MKEKRVLFMGTPEFSVNVLEKLIEYTTVVGVVCQPDKEVGRKKVLTKCPVKVIAEQNNIKVFQPYKLKEEYESILEVNPDVIITCAYGQMLNEEFLNYPKYKTINVHASILPKLRGGAPIERAIMEGHEETGITIMRTDKGMDSGDIITSKSIIIEDTDTKESLSNKLSILGAELLIETLPSIFDETCSYIKQNHDEKTIARIITKEDEYLSFDDTKKNIYNKVRALYPEPACYATLDNERLKIYETTIGDNMCGENGKIVEIYDNGIGVSCKDGEIIIKKLQVAGKKVMTAREYLNGTNKDKLLGKVFNK